MGRIYKEADGVLRIRISKSLTRINQWIVTFYDKAGKKTHAENIVAGTIEEAMDQALILYKGISDVECQSE